MSKQFGTWWNSDITIYNRFENTETNEITWYKTQLSNCFWKDSTSTSISGDIKIESKSIICRIPESDKYLDKEAWLNSEDKENYFTIGPNDIVILGKVEDVIDEETKGSRSTDLINKYKELNRCLVINSFSINTQNIGLKHYSVRGI